MSDVADFYDQNPCYEWERLDRRRTEFAVTLRAFEEYLPPPPAAVLDIGGGPGRYSISLAERGYDMTLVDLSKKCLDLAREKAHEAGVDISCIHGNALTLKFPEEYFDAVFLMGPLYHLRVPEAREKALYEAVRVLKKGNLLFASFITSYAVIRWLAKFEPESIVTHRQQWEQILVQGAADLPRESFVNITWFTHPKQVNPLMEKAGLRHIDLIATEGVVSMIDEKISVLTGEFWETWVDLNYRLGKDCTVQGAAEHLLYVGRKK